MVFATVRCNSQITWNNLMILLAGLFHSSKYDGMYLEVTTGYDHLKEQVSYSRVRTFLAFICRSTILHFQ